MLPHGDVRISAPFDKAPGLSLANGALLCDNNA